MRFSIPMFISILLLIALLGGCTGVQRAPQPLAESISAQPVKVRPQKKNPPPNSLAYYYFMASQSKLREGKIDEAIDDLKQAIPYDEREPSLRVELATLLIHKGL